MKRVAISVPSIGYFQFVKNIFWGLINSYDADKVYIAIKDEEVKVKIKEYDVRLANWEQFILIKDLKNKEQSEQFSLFITPEQYNLGIEGIYSICCFHGPSAKGVTFKQKILESFDALFMLSPLHKETLLEYLQENDVELPKHLEVIDVGYPKSDDVINGKYNKDETIKKLGFGYNKPILLYAPAFNEHSSLRDSSELIINALCKNNKYNVVAKLPIDCHQPVSNLHATGGVDWFSKLKRLEELYENFKIVYDYEIDEYLNAADILITCVSSVGFEFVVLNKPVVFIDAPKFYDIYLKGLFPQHNTSVWKEQITKNGGRQFGAVVEDTSKLQSTVNDILGNKHLYPLNKQQLPQLLFNKGNATSKAVDIILNMISTGNIQEKKENEFRLFGENFLRKYSKLNNKERIVIFGASRFGKLVLKFFENRLVNYDSIKFYLVDNDSNKWGQQINEITIYSPNELQQMNIDAIVIASSYGNDILVQLTEIDINNNEDIDILLVTQ